MPRAVRETPAALASATPQGLVVDACRRGRLGLFLTRIRTLARPVHRLAPWSNGARPQPTTPPADNAGGAGAFPVMSDAHRRAGAPATDERSPPWTRT